MRPEPFEHICTHQFRWLESPSQRTGRAGVIGRRFFGCSMLLFATICSTCLVPTQSCRNSYSRNFLTESELYLKLERKHFSSFTSLLHCHLMLLVESPYQLLLSYYLQVTVGFGTGEITGEFAREQICFGGNSGSVRVPPVARANPSESRPALCQGRTNPTIRCRRLQCALFGAPWLKTTNVVKEHVNEILVAKFFVGWPICCNYQELDSFLTHFTKLPSRNVHRKVVPSHALQDEHHRRRGDVIAALQELSIRWHFGPGFTRTDNEQDRLDRLAVSN